MGVGEEIRMDHRRIARKITLVLFLSQGLSSAGFIAAFTVNALVAVELTGWTAMAGVPGALYVFGQACGALVWGFSMERTGRRRGLAFGQIIGVVGSAIAMAAVVGRSLFFFLGGLILVGMARSAVDLGRFAAAEVHLPAERGRAISKVVLGSTVGAICGPLLVGPTGRLAAAAGFSELAGPYGVGLIGLILAAMLISAGLRPDPRDIGRELARLHPESIPNQTTRSLGEILRQPGVVVAMGSMVFAQMVMMVPMSITSVHMTAHQHPLTAVSLVISAHTLGMFAFSMVSREDDRPMGTRTRDHPRVDYDALFLRDGGTIHQPVATGRRPFPLGAGLEFCVRRRLHAAGRPTFTERKSQDPGIQRSAAEPGLGREPIGSGVVYASGGFGVMGLTAAAAAAVPLTLAIWWQATAAQKR